MHSKFETPMTPSWAPHATILHRDRTTQIVTTSLRPGVSVRYPTTTQRRTTWERRSVCSLVVDGLVPYPECNIRNLFWYKPPYAGVRRCGSSPIREGQTRLFCVRRNGSRSANRASRARHELLGASKHRTILAGGSRRRTHVHFWPDWVDSGKPSPLPFPRDHATETVLDFQHTARVADTVRKSSGQWKGHAQLAIYRLVGRERMSPARSTIVVDQVTENGRDEGVRRNPRTTKPKQWIVMGDLQDTHALKKGRRRRQGEIDTGCR